MISSQTSSGEAGYHHGPGAVWDRVSCRADGLVNRKMPAWRLSDSVDAGL